MGGGGGVQWFRAFGFALLCFRRVQHLGRFAAGDSIFGHHRVGCQVKDERIEPERGRETKKTLGTQTEKEREAERQSWRHDKRTYMNKQLCVSTHGWLPSLLGFSNYRVPYQDYLKYYRVPHREHDFER